MRAIPEQLAAACQTPTSNESSCSIFCSKEVTAVGATEVHVVDQHTFSSQHQYDAVVVATDYPAAKLLLKDQLPAITCSRSATCYFAVPASALASVLERLHTDGTFIILHTYSHHSDVVADGDKRLPVGHTTGSKASRDDGRARVASIAFPSIVQPSYAPAGTHLAAVTVVFLDDTDAQTSQSRPSPCSDSASVVATTPRQHDQAARFTPSTSADPTAECVWVTEAWVRRQVAKILVGKGASASDVESVVSSWQHIRTYNIGCHQPLHAHLRENRDVALEPCLPSGVFVCGDHRGFPTIDGAMRSGARAAEAVLEQFSKLNSTSK